WRSRQGIYKASNDHRHSAIYKIGISLKNCFNNCHTAEGSNPCPDIDDNIASFSRCICPVSKKVRKWLREMRKPRLRQQAIQVVVNVKITAEFAHDLQGDLVKLCYSSNGQRGRDIASLLYFIIGLLRRSATSADRPSYDVPLPPLAL